MSENSRTLPESGDSGKIIIHENLNLKALISQLRDQEDAGKIMKGSTAFFRMFLEILENRWSTAKKVWQRMQPNEIPGRSGEILKPVGPLKDGELELFVNCSSDDEQLEEKKVKKGRKFNITIDYF